MLNKIKTLKGYKLDSLDGDIGSVKEFYFDDQHWAVRYLVVDTGNWLPGRRVLISPYALGVVNSTKQSLSINLTNKQIEESPSLASDKPVSRQFEASYYGYYGWPRYWDGPYRWGLYSNIVRDREKWRGHTRGEKAWDPHLRSTDAVTGYHIQTVDDETWAIRYLAIDTRNWWPGKHILISPLWIESIDWNESKVFVDLSRETIQRSPEYTEESLLTRDYETGLHRHYNRQGYWVDESAA
jgi:hypothetical protein